METNPKKRLVPYRDVNGYVIELVDPKLIDAPFVTAHFVRCPETDSLKTLHACAECPMNDGQAKRRAGQYCKSTKAYRAKFYDTKTTQASLITKKPK